MEAGEQPPAVAFPGTGNSPGQQIGVDTVTSFSSIDPTDPGPFEFELVLENVGEAPFLPIGGSLFIENQENGDEWLYGIIEALDETVDPPVLHVRKVLTSLSTPTAIDAWYITIIDGPPAAVNLYGINGLSVRKNLFFFPYIDIGAGSVRDSSDSINLVLPAKITKRLDLAFAEGDVQGCQVFSATLAGTISAAAGALSGVGTTFLSQIGLSPSLDDIQDQYLNWNFANPQLDPTSGAVLCVINRLTGGVNEVAQASTNTSGMIVSGNTFASTNWRRGGYVGNGGFYAIMIVRRDIDGYIDVASCALNGNGQPDLPAGYTYYRVIALVKVLSPSTSMIIEQPLKGMTSPSSYEISDISAARLIMTQNDIGHNLDAADIAISDLQQNVATKFSDIYTPTISGGVNLDATTAGSFEVIVMGTRALICGNVAVDPTAAAGTATQFDMTLPGSAQPAANFANTSLAHGVSSGLVGTVAENGIVISKTGSKLVTVQFRAQSTANHQMYICATYRM